MQYIYSERIVKKPTSMVVYESRYAILSFLLALLFTVNNLSTYDILTIGVQELNIKTNIEVIQDITSPIVISDEIVEELKDVAKIDSTPVVTEVAEQTEPEPITEHAVVYTSKITITSPSKPANCLDHNFVLSSPINSYSGLTKEDIQSITQDYPVIYNLSEDIYEMEKYNKINAFYTLGVLSLESGYGESDYAKYKNNLCGLLKKNKNDEYIPIHFNTQRDSIVYFAELMRDYYVPNGWLTPENIQPIYEPRNNRWDDDVVDIMNRFAKRYESIKNKEEN